MRQEDWRGLSVLYVTPLRALLNNLHPRLSSYAAWLGRRVGLWHGDVGQGERRRLLADPPDVLLTTPESLEAMLVSTQVRNGDVRPTSTRSSSTNCTPSPATTAADTARRPRTGCNTSPSDESSASGYPPRSAIPRSFWNGCRAGAPGPSCAGHRTAGRDGTSRRRHNARLRRIVSQHSNRDRRTAQRRSDLRVLRVSVQAEELAGALRGLNIQAFVSHSSLSADERRRSEQASAEARDCVVIATSTLELGIDVGDLNRVIQLDSPRTVASFLKGFSRTGRRTGSTRNTLVLATRSDSLLQAAALLAVATGFRRTRATAAEPPAHRGTTTPGTRAPGRGHRPVHVARMVAGLVDDDRRSTDPGLVDDGVPGGRRRDGVRQRCLGAPLRSPKLHGPHRGVHRGPAVDRHRRPPRNSTSPRCHWAQPGRPTWRWPDVPGG